MFTNVKRKDYTSSVGDGKGSVPKELLTAGFIYAESSTMFWTRTIHDCREWLRTFQKSARYLEKQKALCKTGLEPRKRHYTISKKQQPTAS